MIYFLKAMTNGLQTSISKVYFPQVYYYASSTLCQLISFEQICSSCPFGKMRHCPLWTFAEFHVSRLWPPPDSSIANHASESQARISEKVISGEWLLSSGFGKNLALPTLRLKSKSKYRFNSKILKAFFLGESSQMPVWIGGAAPLAMLHFIRT